MHILLIQNIIPRGESTMGDYDFMANTNNVDNVWMGFSPHTGAYVSKGEG